MCLGLQFIDDIPTNPIKLSLTGVNKVQSVFELAFVSPSSLLQSTTPILFLKSCNLLLQASYSSSTGIVSFTARLEGISPRIEKSLSKLLEIFYKFRLCSVPYILHSFTLFYVTMCKFEIFEVSLISSYRLLTETLE